ncbi:hypothetical protein MP228_003796 [Amoeboaphelidium protococcarum]|nr:hypothetical protein MP228_004033 [Amoeboaphelidium protococcarum]KAI3651042.1 hypothetical protein MP228_004523 [Amoeboaphelidium protococcarum]KAI3651350.1 hypothetical protein MP228_003796 [Amoeboaphelidium protococcarum]
MVQFNDKQRQFVQEVLDGKNVFLSGLAGTGKTHCLKSVCLSLSRMHKKFQVVSPNNISSQKIPGARTINSCFMLPYDYETLDTAALNNGWYVKRLLRNIRILIIDEVSLLSCQQFAFLDRLISQHKRNQNAFGGLQIIVVGDFHQLGPVIIQEGPVDDSQNYYAFQSDAWRRCNFKFTYLDEIYRHDVPQFINTVNAIRVGERLNGEQLQFLETLVENPDDSDNLQYVMSRFYLFGTRERAQEHNDQIAQRIQKKKRKFTASDVITVAGADEVDISCEKIDKELCLWQGARVMVIENYKPDDIYNGMIGRVSRFDNDGFPIVSFKVRNQTKQIRFKQHKFDLKNSNKQVVGHRRGLALCLAYGLTVHKVQGDEFKDLTIDFSDFFAMGQSYVALGRSSFIENLRLINFSEYYVRVSEVVKNFYAQLLIE